MLPEKGSVAVHRLVMALAKIPTCGRSALFGDWMATFCDAESVVAPYWPPVTGRSFATLPTVKPSFKCIRGRS